MSGQDVLDVSIEKLSEIGCVGCDGCYKPYGARLSASHPTLFKGVTAAGGCDSGRAGVRNELERKQKKAFLADLPDVAILRECLDYDPHSGELTWKRRPASHFLTEASAKSWNSRFAGRAAFTCSHKGRKPRHGRISLNGKTHYLEADRSAWAMFHGQPPETPLRFRNGDRTDIRISNLEPVSARELVLAIPRKRRFLPGAYRDDRRGCWWSALHVGGRQIYLGRFDSAEEANATWLAARAKREADFAAARQPNDYD